MARDPPPWDEVRTFLAVARGGGLKAAAASLRASEATVSRRLRALEARLGVRLFDRLPNRLAPTPLAGRLVAAAVAMEEGAAGFARLARAAAAAPEEPVRVTATGSVSLFLARHLGRVLAGAPGARLQLLGTRTTLSLSRREAELALRMRRPPEAGDGDLFARCLGRVAFALYAARGDPLEAGRLPYIGLREDPASRQSRWLDAAAGAAGAPVPVRLDDVHLRLEAARGGVGAALLPCHLGDADPGLRRLRPPPPELVEDVFLLAHRDLKDLPPVADAPGRALARLFREEAGALLGDGPRAPGA